MVTLRNPDSITASTVSMGQTIAAYSHFLPPIREVRQASSDDPTMRQDVLIGQVAAGAITLSVGMMSTWLTNSAIPATVALTIAVVIALVYEYALKTRGNAE